MPRKEGLGPLGRAAVQRAAEHAQAPRAAQIRTLPTSDITQGNPSVISTSADERETMPAPEDWWVPPKPSSRIATAAYDPGSQRLYVLFQKPHPVGTPWTYEGVTTQEWRNFRRVKSPGQYVNRVLNGKNYHRGTWLD